MDTAAVGDNIKHDLGGGGGFKKKELLKNMTIIIKSVLH